MPDTKQTDIPVKDRQARLNKELEAMEPEARKRFLEFTGDEALKAWTSGEKAPDPVEPGPVTITRTFNLGESVQRSEIVEALSVQSEVVSAFAKDGKVPQGDSRYRIEKREGQLYLEYKMTFDKGETPEETGDTDAYVEQHFPQVAKVLMESDVALDG